MSDESFRDDVCATCGAKAPDARTTSTLTLEGWRLISLEGAEAGARARYGWCCPTCLEKRTGSAPLRRPTQPVRRR
jgi:hypothetical protein